MCERERVSPHPQRRDTQYDVFFVFLPPSHPFLRERRASVVLLGRRFPPGEARPSCSWSKSSCVAVKNEKDLCFVFDFKDTEASRWLRDVVTPVAVTV